MCAEALSRVAICESSGQGTVEAAFVIPVMFLLLLLLIQPGIILYDRMVMSAAAAEGCRLLATSSEEYGSVSDACEAFVRHRLASIPPLACFHVHEGGCSWDIDSSGDETASVVEVSIKNQVRPLPLLDVAATMLGIANSSGNIEVAVTCEMPTQPAWVQSATSDDPVDWPGAWL